MTKGPPLAIGSPMGLPAINKNSVVLFAFTISLFPLSNNIKFELLVLTCSFSPIFN
jgi:hypothetical protein